MMRRAMSTEALFNRIILDEKNKSPDTFVHGLSVRFKRRNGEG